MKQFPAVKKMLLFLVVMFPAAGFSEGYVRTIRTFEVPPCVLMDQNGAPVSLPSIMRRNKPIILDFIYTSCRSVCPLQSANFANMQYRLKGETEKPRLISITIDPGRDNASVTREYLKRFRAEPGWDFLTGSPECIAAFMNAFSRYTKKKMGYFPLVFIYVPAQGRWIQMEGFVNAVGLIEEFRKAKGK